MIIPIQDITLDLAGAPVDRQWSEQKVVPPIPGSDEKAEPAQSEYGNVVIAVDLDGKDWQPLKKAQ